MTHFHRMNGSIQLFKENEAARYLRLSVATLRRRRLLRQQPVWIKLGSRVFYRATDLDAFVSDGAARLSGADGEQRGRV